MKPKRAEPLEDRTDPDLGSKPTQVDALVAVAAIDTATSSSAELQAMLEDLEAQRAYERAEIARLEAFENENVLDASDDVLDENARSIVALRRRALRLDKWAERIRARLQQAKEQEIEHARTTRYSAAAERLREAEDWIRESYATHAGAIAAGLARLEAIAEEIAAANKDLPEGVAPLDTETFRALPATPGRTTHRAEIYFVDESGAEVREKDDLKISHDPSGYWIGGPDRDRRRVIARERQVPVHEPGRPRASPRPLTAAVRLPGVQYGDSDFWPARSKAWGQ